VPSNYTLDLSMYCIYMHLIRLFIYLCSIYRYICVNKTFSKYECVLILIRKYRIKCMSESVVVRYSLHIKWVVAPLHLLPKLSGLAFLSSSVLWYIPCPGSACLWIGTSPILTNATAPLIFLFFKL